MANTKLLALPNSAKRTCWALGSGVHFGVKTEP